MSGCLSVLKYFCACLIVGTLYGAVGGAFYGTTLILFFVLLSGEAFEYIGFGALYGLLFGSGAGVAFGLLGGTIGGPAGWAFAGFVGGVVGCTIEQPTVSIDLFNLLPAVLLTVVGIFIGHSQAYGSPSLPLTRWLYSLWNQAHPLHQIIKLRVSLALLGFIAGITYIAMKVTIHH